MSKVYEGTITLGSSTPSYDLETEIDNVFPTDHITHELIYKTKASFIGKIAQKPPVFSALKKDGKRMYEYAREGKELEVKARFVEILEFEILGINMHPSFLGMKVKESPPCLIVKITIWENHVPTVQKNDTVLF